ncbi:MAG: hypothetical protein LBU11_02955 [Zoogloeaceae bacterium]|nr:hypothetical protein [Zoogloeaceae bacterium]
MKDAKAQPSAGAYLDADVDFARRFSFASPWHLVGDARVSWRGNEKSALSEMNIRESQWGRVALGLRRMTSATLAEAWLKAEIFDYDFYQHVSSIGSEAAFLWAASPTFHLISRDSVDRRDYSLDPERNGKYGWAGEYARPFFGANNHEFLSGGRYLYASANRKDHGYNGREASVRFLLKLPRGFELSPFAAWSVERYNGPRHSAGKKRPQGRTPAPQPRLELLIGYRASGIMVRESDASFLGSCSTAANPNPSPAIPLSG